MPLKGNAKAEKKSWQNAKYVSFLRYTLNEKKLSLKFFIAKEAETVYYFAFFKRKVSVFVFGFLAKFPKLPSLQFRQNGLLRLSTK